MRIEAGPAFWGPSSTPEDIAEPDHAAIVVSLIENDNATPEQYQTLLRAVVPISLASSLGEPDSGQRAARLTNAIRDALNGIDLPFPFALDDDHIGTQQLRLDRSDLLGGGAKEKIVRIQSAEGHYELGFRITAFQPEWRFCGKCKSLFFDGDAANKGICAVGGGHEAAGLIFALMHDGALQPGLQSDWRFCGKCRTLFFDGDPASKGACPAGGGHEAAGFNFALLHTTFRPLATISRTGGSAASAWRSSSAGSRTKASAPGRLQAVTKRWETTSSSRSTVPDPIVSRSGGSAASASRCSSTATLRGKARVRWVVDMRLLGTTSSSRSTALARIVSLNGDSVENA